MAYTKGYKRCSVLLITLQGIKELSLQDHVPARIRAPWVEWNSMPGVLLNVMVLHVSKLFSHGVSGLLWNYPLQFWGVQGRPSTSPGEPRPTLGVFFVAVHRFPSWTIGFGPILTRFALAQAFKWPRLLREGKSIALICYDK